MTFALNSQRSLMMKCWVQKKSPASRWIVNVKNARLQSGRSPSGRYSTFFTARKYPDSHQPSTSRPDPPPVESRARQRGQGMGRSTSR